MLKEVRPELKYRIPYSVWMQNYLYDQVQNLRSLKKLGLFPWKSFCLILLLQKNNCGHFFSPRPYRCQINSITTFQATQCALWGTIRSYEHWRGFLLAMRKTYNDIRCLKRGLSTKKYIWTNKTVRFYHLSEKKNIKMFKIPSKKKHKHITAS